MLFNGPHCACGQPQTDFSTQHIALDAGMLEIGKEPAARAIVRMADIVA